MEKKERAKHQNKKIEEKKEKPTQEPEIESTSGKPTCILCCTELNFFALGPCDHNEVCHTCSLRTRLIMEDEQCPICRTDLDEIIITADRDLTWSLASKRLLKKCD